MPDTNRQQLLDKLSMMIAHDFGMPNENGVTDSLCAHCVAHQGLKMIKDAYQSLDHQNSIDMQAQKIIDAFQSGDPDIDNITSVH